MSTETLQGREPSTESALREMAEHCAGLGWDMEADTLRDAADEIAQLRAERDEARAEAHENAEEMQRLGLAMMDAEARCSRLEEVLGAIAADCENCAPAAYIALDALTDSEEKP